jgi:hypothetical protein
VPSQIIIRVARKFKDSAKLNINNKTNKNPANIKIV